MKEKTIYALGFFDGVHLGHQALLYACNRLARSAGIGTAAITFEQHPQSLFAQKPPLLINTTLDRCRLLEQFGIERILTYPVNEAVMHMPWQDFLKELVRYHGAYGFVCGYDFRFGRKGEGNAEKLRVFCGENGLPCLILPEQQMDGEKISSTRIRGLLEQGDVENANRLLGHPHTFTGTVVSGQKLGRTLGIPTANLELPKELLTPALGVYACRAWVDGKSYVAVTNIGTRPTVAGKHIVAEAWLQDFSGDLYGKELTLTFHAFLRPEKKFPSLEALKEEILKNRQETLNFFEKK